MRKGRPKEEAGKRGRPYGSHTRPFASTHALSFPPSLRTVTSHEYTERDATMMAARMASVAYTSAAPAADRRCSTGSALVVAAGTTRAEPRCRGG